MQHSPAVTVLLQRGHALHQSGDLRAAADLYQEVLAQEPEHPEALYLLGTALLQLGDPESATAPLKRAARALRNHPGVSGNLAQAYFARGLFEEAENTFRSASRLDSRNVHFKIGIASSMAMRGNLHDAEVLLRRLAQDGPGAAVVWLNLGNVLRDQQRLEEASSCFSKALELDAGFADAHNNLGRVLHALYRFDEAETAYRACLAVAPDHLYARLNLASVLIDAGRFREAEATCREIIERAPAAAMAHTFRGAALGHQGRLHEALECHRRAVEIEPQDPKLAENYGAALADAGDLRGALDWFHRVLSQVPDSTTARALVGHALLSHGRIADGWAGYAFRPAYSRFQSKYPDVSLARTLPDNVSGKHIFLMREQGLGDEIFFLRFARVLAAGGARVTYRASNKLHSLIERSSCVAEVVDEEAPVPQADAAMLVADLPGALGRPAPTERFEGIGHDVTESINRFPLRISVFWPELPATLRIEPLATNLAAARRQLDHAGPPPYVAVTWRAGTSAHEQQGDGAWNLKKETPLEILAGALRGLPGTVVALQRAPRAGELEALSRHLGRPVHDFSALNEDLESMLAALSLIDEYVGVSNTNMHLRAAAGRTARVIVPCPAEWRWMASGAASPWFPGFSIYRQSLDGEWSRAFAMLKLDLAKAFT